MGAPQVYSQERDLDYRMLETVDFVLHSSFCVCPKTAIMLTGSTLWQLCTGWWKVVSMYSYCFLCSAINIGAVYLWHHCCMPALFNRGMVRVIAVIGCVFVYTVPPVVITPHGGVAPPMASQSQSGPIQQQQQQQQTPQAPTSSGHQTPTPSQHTPYGPGVGVMPSAAGTPPQTHHVYHLPQQHVIAQQGPAAPSPQVTGHCAHSSLLDDGEACISVSTCIDK